MASLPNPGFVCALGNWIYNVEIEKAEKLKRKEIVCKLENGSANGYQNGSAELKSENNIR